MDASSFENRKSLKAEFTENINLGDQALKQNKYDRAMAYFNEARDKAYHLREPKLLSRARQKLGVAKQLKYQDLVASRIFAKNFELVVNSFGEFEQGLFLRDWALNDIRTKKIRSAHEHIDQAIDIFYNMADEFELAITYGYEGLVCLLEEEKEHAVNYMLRADELLCGRNDIYELQNLCNLVKVEPWRFGRLARVVRLLFTNRRKIFFFYI